MHSRFPGHASTSDRGKDSGCHTQSPSDGCAGAGAKTHTLRFTQSVAPEGFANAARAPVDPGVSGATPGAPATGVRVPAPRRTPFVSLSVWHPRDSPAPHAHQVPSPRPAWGTCRARCEKTAGPAHSRFPGRGLPGFTRHRRSRVARPEASGRAWCAVGPGDHARRQGLRDVPPSPPHRVSPTLANGSHAPDRAIAVQRSAGQPVRSRWLGRENGNAPGGSAAGIQLK